MAGITYKNMISYHQYAWNDAMGLAQWLEREFPLADIWKHHERMSFEACEKFEETNSHFIQELIKKTEGQRPAYLRKIGKNSDTFSLGLLLLFAVIAQLRVKDLFDLRDEYFWALNPGSGNRVTCQGIYEYMLKVKQVTSNYDWPHDIFDAYGGGLDFDEADDDEMDPAE